MNTKYIHTIYYFIKITINKFEKIVFEIVLILTLIISITTQYFEILNFKPTQGGISFLI